MADNMAHTEGSVEVCHMSVCATLKTPTRVSLKTPPTIISSPYQLNKQVEQSGEFINIK